MLTNQQLGDKLILLIYQQILYCIKRKQMKKLFMILNNIMLAFILIFDVLYMINGGLLL